MFCDCFNHDPHGVLNSDRHLAPPSPGKYTRPATPVCHVCGEELCATDRIYLCLGKAMGCQHCVDVEEAGEAGEADEE